MSAPPTKRAIDPDEFMPTDIDEPEEVDRLRSRSITRPLSTKPALYRGRTPEQPG
jgi:hypothetical protein